MTDTQVERLAALAMAYIRTHPSTPYDTGNLKLNALQMEKVAPYVYKIYIDLDIAPYQRVLNDVERFDSGRRNRHFQWWEKMRVNVAQYLATFAEKGAESVEKELAEKLKEIEKMNGGNTIT